ncbi:hypothetical protein C3V36_12805 [Lachnospiraceae bacterium oral taxon 500]|nr:hypothetical protein C3V36_12805 [Lachnospiraceae bacterium oral taxon 500]
MKKLWTAAVLMVAVLSLSACVADETQTKDNPTNASKHEDIEAKVVSFESFEEMDNNSGIVVKVIKEDSTKDRILIDRHNGKPVFGCTLSKVKVLDVYKDESKEILPGQEITIYENEYYDEESDITYHVESYQAIKAGEERLLFFKEKNIMQDKTEYYTPQGIYYGSISLSADRSAAVLKRHGDEEYTPSQDVVEIWEAAKAKYLKE